MRQSLLPDLVQSAVANWRGAELAGRIFADLARTGQPIGLVDSIIAATALQHKLSLVTGNLSHYR